MKNVTLSAEESQIERAREVARKRSTTLNQLFREWLENLTHEPDRVSSYDRLMKQLSEVKSGRRFSRDESNER
jgi:hypothetical protein